MSSCHVYGFEDDDQNPDDYAESLQNYQIIKNYKSLSNYSNLYMIDLGLPVQVIPEFGYVVEDCR